MQNLVDTHCHLNHHDFAADLDLVLHRAESSGVTRIICVGYDLPSSIRAVELAEKYSHVFAAVGIHPHDAKTFEPEVEAKLAQLASESQKVVAIGETGLDYYRNLSPRDIQQDAYRRHIKLAQTLGLPLIIHSREAWQDVIRILDEENMPKQGVVMHCLPSEPEFAKASLERGCFVGIAGPVTFLNAEKLRKIVAEIPLEQMLIETDAPYLAPHPHRGKRNEPSYLPLIATCLAEVKGTPPSQIAKITTANATQFFNIGAS
ncbi:MAG: TatD family hydrolase [Armatimonadota bacterium]|jgi:TatD DNase family protein|nr:TatD family hydrolase [Armatimonadota bacterium]